MKKTFACMALAAALAPFASAHAAVITYTDSKALTTTNWLDALSFSKFDTSLGTLTSIRFDLEGVVQGVGSAESLDTSASTVTLSLGSLLGLTRPDHTTLVVTNPVFTQTFDFTAFDNSANFAGTSGGSTGTVSATGSNFFVSNNASDFALFSALGGGTIALGIDATGNSSGTGSGNLITQFNTSASGVAKVTYTYTPTTPTGDVPEPASLALVCGGLGLLGAIRRKKA
jgi:hypothetical protein